MRVILTRPRAQAEATAADLAGKGIEVWIEPMFDVVPRADVVIDLAGVQAILVTSANGAAALARASARRDLPVFAVGDATAAALRATGFAAVESAHGAAGDLARLARARLTPAAGALLHAAGARVAGDLAGPLAAAGFELRRAVLYDAAPARVLSDGLRAALRAHSVDGALFFSPRTAELFARLARAASCEDDVARLMAFCLSESVAAAARAIGWRRVLVSDRPEGAALVSLVAAAAAGAGGS